METKETSWRGTYEATKKQIKEWLVQFSKYQEDPEYMMEFLKFGSQFYHYSLRNTELIYKQNPNVTFVQAYHAWKKMGAHVNEKNGIKVYVPKQVTYLMIKGEKPIQLKYATKEQRDAYKKGEIPGKKIIRYGIGNVYDISQTDLPQERYSKLLQMGEISIEHQQWIRILAAYAENELCDVKEENLRSVSLRGFYDFGKEQKEIVLNTLLKDTEKLSTLTHEIGHALTVREDMDGNEAELRADMISMMLHWKMELEVTDTRKSHFKKYYLKLWKEYGEKAGERMEQILEEVFQCYKKMTEELKRYQKIMEIPEKTEEKHERIVKTF